MNAEADNFKVPLSPGCRRQVYMRWSAPETRIGPYLLSGLAGTVARSRGGGGDTQGDLVTNASKADMAEECR